MNYSPVNTVSLILVVRNEEVALGSMLPRLPTNVFDDCFAIDGNSRDRTVEILESAGIRSYRQSRPGLGAARLEGRAHVTTDAFVFFSPDGNEEPADLPRVVTMLREGNPFVVASRMIEGAWNEEDDQLFKWRKYANQGFVLLANLLFSRGGNRTTDVTNGFRGISCQAWDAMKITSEDLTIDYQMVIRALKAGIPIKEFPTREGQRIGGETNFPSLQTGLAELGLLIRETRMGRRSLES